jgi:trimeric autotransporter adhesin
MGYHALYNNTTGYSNSGFGYTALAANTTGFDNTAFGYYALDNITTGDHNTAIGYNAGPSSTYSTVSNTTSIGNGAAVTANNQVRIGNSSVTSIGGYQPWSDLSDGRFKENVSENVPGLDFIRQLRPVTYRINFKMVDDYTGAKDDNAGLSETRTGFIAQEVEEAAANIGFDFNGVDRPKNDKDMYGLRYAGFVVPLVKAVQEQQSIIENLQSKIESLQKQIDELYLKLSIFETK